MVVNEATVNLQPVKVEKKVSSQPSTKISEAIFKIDNDVESNDLYESENREEIKEESRVESETVSEIAKEYKIVQMVRCKAVGKPIEHGY